MQRRWEEQPGFYFVGSSFKVSQLSMLATQTVALVNKVVAVLILFFGAKLVIENRLTVGELVAFNMLAGQLSGPVLRLAQLWQDFQQARISVDRLGDILNATPEPGVAGVATLPPIRGDIQLEHVSFRYRLDASFVLEDVSLKVPAGQVIGIVGSSGSGQDIAAASSSGSTCPRAAGCWWTAWTWPWPTRRGFGASSASSCRKTCCSTGP